MAKNLPRVEDEWFERMNLASQGWYQATTEESIDADDQGEFDQAFFNQMNNLRRSSEAIKQRKKEGR